MFFTFLLAKIYILTYYYMFSISYNLKNVFSMLKKSIKLVTKSKLHCMKKIAKISFAILTSLLLVGILIVGSFFVFVNTSNSGVKFDKEKLEAQNSTIDIYSQKGEKINAKNGKKALVKLETLPSYVPASFVSIEDKNFYTHDGLNYKRIAKAFINNLKSHSLKEGASTISQQLIKNTHLSSDKTIKRKLNEMALAKQLEKNFSKDEIMETYLNVIYFGAGAYGIENASETYFGKTAPELTLDESAMLAGMIKSPKTYSPLTNMETATKRRNLVLSEMKKDGKITQSQFESAINKKIEIKQNLQKKQRNFYEEATLIEAENILNLTENEIALNHYKIFTYLDEIDQIALHNNITDDAYYEKNDYGNIADGCGVVIDNSSGGITAFDAKSIYDVVNMKRSPGSSIKPIIVYAPALECGEISPDTMILDEDTYFGNYHPQNVGAKYYGYVSATTSVEKSLNIPAIKIMEQVGIDRCKKMAENCGITFATADNNYALALGGMTNGTGVVELANTYLPFSQNGDFIKAKFIKKICDETGKTIYKNKQIKTKVMSPETAYLTTEMLKSGVKKGTSSRLNKLPFEVAGKTGTVGIKGTNQNSDVWSVGYTPQKTACVWLGNSTNKKEFLLNGSNNGGTYCTSILRDTLKNVNIDKSLNFEMPDGIEQVYIDLPTLEKEHLLMLADNDTPERYKKLASFNKKYSPTIIAQKFDKNNICKIEVLLIDNKPNVNFDAIKNARYKLFRIEEDEMKLLKEFDDILGKQTFVDNSTLPDTIYTYYIEVKLEDEKGNIKSNSQKICTKKTVKSAFDKLVKSW